MATGIPERSNEARLSPERTPNTLEGRLTVDPNRKSIVVVTGMHRSGTSALTRGLLALGFDLGDNLLNPSERENPTGYWEDLDILALSEKVLNLLGRRWQSVKPLYPQDFTACPLDPLIEEGRALISGKMRGLPAWAFKNPRTGPLLPFWKAVFESLPIDARYVAVVRNPHSVVRSLEARNGFAAGYGYALWTAHYLDTLRNLADAPCTFVSYEQLLADPAGQLRRVSEALGRPWDSPVEAAVEAYARDFVSQDLNHFDSVEADLQADASCFDETRELYELLSELCRKRAPLSPSVEHARIADNWQQRQGRLIQILEAHEAGIDGRAVQYEERIQVQNAHLQNLRNAIDVLRTDRGKLESLLDGYEGAVQSLLASSRWRTGNAIGELKRRLLARAEVPLATHFIKDLSTQFDDWRHRDRIDDPADNPPRRHDAARVFSGNIAAPRAGQSDAPRDANAIQAFTALTALATAPPVTIIVPVYNALEDVRRCVRSLLRNTTTEATLCLIDDASTDEATSEQLREYARIGNVELLTNDSNLGFTATVNRGLAQVTGDVVLLNSDTIVGPRWLENIRFAAYSDGAVGTVTAISDNAGAFSFPVAGHQNPVPAGLSGDDIARLVFQNSGRAYPSVPTGNGFCLYIKQAVLKRVGSLDAEKFPRGYGEENDFCMRSAAAGFSHLIDDATYVFHREGASFGESRNGLMKAGRRRVSELYPQYDGLVAAAFSSRRMAGARQTMQDTFDAANAAPVTVRPRILVMVHQAEGGMNQTVFDLLCGLDAQYQSFVLLSDGETLNLLAFEGGELHQLTQIHLEESITDCRSPHPEYRRQFAAILQAHRIEMVHMHHLLSSCLDVCDVLRVFDIPLILSLHDFFYLCPTVNLLDHEDVYCAGRCTQGEGTCPVPFRYLAKIEGLKHGWVFQWRDRLSLLLDAADAIVAPSQHVIDVYRAAFPKLEDGSVALIEHGRDLDSDRDCGAPPKSGAPVRILVPGVIARHKGAEYIRALAKLDGGRRLEFHFMGRIPPSLEGIGIAHGSYEVSDFADRVREIGPAFIGLFSITAETYAHVLAESWACGVPVLVLDIGTQADRVRSHGGGWILDRHDLKAAYRTILDVCADTEAYEKQRANAGLHGVSTVEEMARRYDHLYRSVRHSRLAFAPREAVVSKPLKLAVLPQRNSDGTPISSGDIRLILPLTHNMARHTIDVTITDFPDLFESGDGYDAVIVQRTAVPAAQTDQFVAACRERSLPYVMDIDDDLLSGGHAEADHYAKLSHGLETLISNAAAIHASTATLAARFENRNDNIAVLPNALDERIWFAPQTRSTERVRTYDGIGLLYMGTETHAEDLHILKRALEGLKKSAHGSDIRLFVIGGEPAHLRADWYTRIDVPLDRRPYPQFVSWLRSFKGYWDIGLAPLADTKFNQGKSALKYLEYAALGLPGVYTDLAPYRDTVRAGQTGLLAGNDPLAWRRAIEALAESATYRSEIAEAARNDILQNHLLGDAAERYAARIAVTVGMFQNR